MIVPQNFPEILRSFDYDQLEPLRDASYVSLHLAGNYGIPILSAYSFYDKITEWEMQSIGGIYCDVETFNHLVQETLKMDLFELIESLNPNT